MCAITDPCAAIHILHNPACKLHFTRLAQHQVSWLVNGCSFPLYLCCCSAHNQTHTFHKLQSYIVPSCQSCQLCRYEDLKQQLLAAQNLAEQEGDQQELARAAAAVARLTFPSSGAVDTSSRPALVIAACASCCWAVMLIGQTPCYLKTMPNSMANQLHYYDLNVLCRPHKTHYYAQAAMVTR